MKKLLSFLSSIAFTASASSAVASCSNLGDGSSKNIDEIIKNKDLGRVNNVNENILKNALKEKNTKIDVDKLSLTNVDLFEGTATFVPKNRAVNYNGQAIVNFDFGNVRKDSQYLWEVVNNTWLGTITSNNSNEILEELVGLNPLLDKKELEVKDINTWGATIAAKSSSSMYKGQITVSYNVINETGDSSAKSLYSVITNSWLGEINKGEDDRKTEENIINAVLTKNNNLDKNELKVKELNQWGATIGAVENSKKYKDESYVSFTLKGDTQGESNENSKSLYSEVKTTWLGNIENTNETSILNALKAKNPNLDIESLTLKETNQYNSILIPKSGTTKYKDQVWLSYSVSGVVIPSEKKELNQVITTKDYDKNLAINLNKEQEPTSQQVKDLIYRSNPQLDINQIDINSISQKSTQKNEEGKEYSQYSANVKALENSYNYNGSVEITFYTSYKNQQQKELSTIIKETNLGEISENSDLVILNTLVEKNNAENLNLGELVLSNKNDSSATISAVENSANYKGSVNIAYTVKKENTEQPENIINLSEHIKTSELGELKDAKTITILEELKNKNKDLHVDEVEVKNITSSSAIIKTISNSKHYNQSQVEVKFYLKDNAEKPKPSNEALLVGYWYEWGGANQHNDPVKLLESSELLNSAYNVIDVSFLYTWEPYAMPTFDPFSPQSKSRIIDAIKKLQNAGKKVILSMGGATGGEMRFKSDQVDQLTATFVKYMDEYNFDGIDIDWEGGVLGDRQSQQTTISALKKAKEIQNSKGKEFLITMAPELPYLKYNTEAGSQGSYIPFLKGLEGIYDFINPQYYNGWAFGPFVDQEEKDYLGINTSYISNDDVEYRGEFYYLVTKYLTTKKSAQNDFYEKIPTNKFVLGAATNEPAGRGAATRESIYNAHVLLENDNIYIRGLMTWAINYDAVFNWQFEA
ncbi:glycosyl hydrolase family 18 protein [Spiroplasma floricola]|uniref:chitinase n=1 Tax=Spiroplasma floricola 23-6 TaxID=1336749 RepID=A0A2K8SCZ8_9MOLU|nr:glycosyl hydrolase family 18 protein [Spiroplasma floricola]AUB31339.1 hypothetical protein SFLOR_v1c02820 [Spiroplasma floricola 23-6]